MRTSGVVSGPNETGVVTWKLQFTFRPETTPEVPHVACLRHVPDRCPPGAARRPPAMGHSAAAQAPPPVPTPLPTPTPIPVPPLRVAPLPWFVFDAWRFRVADRIPRQPLTLGYSRPTCRAAQTIVVGAHVYLVRKGGFGVGAEAVRGASSNQRLDATGEGTGPIIRRRLEGASGQLSLNSSARVRAGATSPGRRTDEIRFLPGRGQAYARWDDYPQLWRRRPLVHQGASGLLAGPAVLSDSTGHGNVRCTGAGPQARDPPFSRNLPK